MKKWFIVLLLISPCCFSQDASIFKPDSVKREIVATRISTPLRIDGMLDEAEWKLAQPSPDFIQVEPLQGQAPNQRTTTLILYNRQFLYVGIIAHDSSFLIVWSIYNNTIITFIIKMR